MTTTDLCPRLAAGDADAAHQETCLDCMRLMTARRALAAAPAEATAADLRRVWGGIAARRDVHRGPLVLSVAMAVAALVLAVRVMLPRSEPDAALVAGAITAGGQPLAAGSRLADGVRWEVVEAATVEVPGLRIEAAAGAALALDLAGTEVRLESGVARFVGSDAGPVWVRTPHGRVDASAATVRVAVLARQTRVDVQAGEAEVATGGARRVVRAGEAVAMGPAADGGRARLGGVSGRIDDGIVARMGGVAEAAGRRGAAPERSVRIGGGPVAADARGVAVDVRGAVGADARGGTVDVRGASVGARGVVDGRGVVGADARGGPVDARGASVGAPSGAGAADGRGGAVDARGGAVAADGRGVAVDAQNGANAAVGAGVSPASAAAPGAAVPSDGSAADAPGTDAPNSALRAPSPDAPHVVPGTTVDATAAPPDPTLARARAILATDPAAARALTETVRAHQPTPAVEAEALMIESDAARRGGDLAAALALCARVIAHPSGQPYAEEASLRAARIHVALGDPARARERLDHARRRFPRGALRPEREALAAQLARNAGELESAAALLEAVPMEGGSVVLAEERLAVAEALRARAPARARALALPLMEARWPADMRARAARLVASPPR